MTGVGGEGDRLQWFGGTRRTLVLGTTRRFGGRAHGDGAQPTADGGRGKESGKPVDKPFGFLVYGECGWGGGGREGGVVVVGVEVVNWGASPAQQGSATASVSLPSVTDAA